MAPGGGGTTAGQAAWRAQVKKGTPQGKELEAIMREGKLVPTEVTVGLLRAAMQRSAATKFLIDGFPRALDQAHVFEQDIKPPDLVIYLDCPQARATCSLDLLMCQSWQRRGASPGCLSNTLC